MTHDTRGFIAYIKLVAGLSGLFWAVQSLTFVLFFGSVITHAIVQLFVLLGVPFPKTGLENFFGALMQLLSWPIRPLFPSAWSDASMLTALFLLLLNSLIWGGVGGTILFLWRRKPRDATRP